MAFAVPCAILTGNEAAMDLTKQEALEFLRRVPLGAVATSSRRGDPEVALVNFAVTDELELVFQTIQTTRKCTNLRDNPRTAFMAWSGDETLQYEGVADEPDEFALEPLLKTFFASVPSALGQRGWPGLVYFRVRPRWLRLSFYGASWSVKELKA